MSEPFDTIYVRPATAEEREDGACACSEDGSPCGDEVTRVLTLERVATSLLYCEDHYQIILATHQTGWILKPVTLMGQP